MHPPSADKAGGGVAIAFVALGSNLGDRRTQLKRALQRLADLPQTRCLKSSSWYETKPVGGPPQGMFLNGVVQIETTVGPLVLLDHLQEIEKMLGRPSEHGFFEPRVIDLDLLSYDDTLIQSPRLVLPHPRLHEREFVLIPLLEIAPEWRHPKFGKSARELLEELTHEDCKNRS